MQRFVVYKRKFMSKKINSLEDISTLILQNLCVKDKDSMNTGILLLRLLVLRIIDFAELINLIFSKLNSFSSCMDQYFLYRECRAASISRKHIVPFKKVEVTLK